MQDDKMNQSYFSEIKLRIKDSFKKLPTPELLYTWTGFVYGIYETNGMSLQQYEEVLDIIRNLGAINEDVLDIVIIGDE